MYFGSVLSVKCLFRMLEGLFLKPRSGFLSFSFSLPVPLCVCLLVLVFVFFGFDLGLCLASEIYVDVLVFVICFFSRVF